MTPEEAAQRLAGLDLAAHLAKLVGAVVYTAERGIKARTPVRTGHLRRSITGQVRSATEGVVGTNVIYARPVHRRQPFIEEGLDDVMDEIDRLVAEAGVTIWSQVV